MTRLLGVLESGECRGSSETIVKYGFPEVHLPIKKCIWPKTASRAGFQRLYLFQFGHSSGRKMKKSEMSGSFECFRCFFKMVSTLFQYHFKKDVE